MDTRETIEHKVALVSKLITELRVLKEQHPEFSVSTRESSGSILNAYREGDITFEHAKDMIDKMSCAEKVKMMIDVDGIADKVSRMYASKSRSEIWETLHDTEFSGKSSELNEIMVRMTDADVAEWFPRIYTEYILRELGLIR
jgi:hypothetical protein